ncbi:hypothetical protein GCM10020258_11360 [Sphingomonas yabuuchiae]
MRRSERRKVARPDHPVRSRDPPAPAGFGLQQTAPLVDAGPVHLTLSVDGGSEDGDLGIEPLVEPARDDPSSALARPQPASSNAARIAAPEIRIIRP